MSRAMKKDLLIADGMLLMIQGKAGNWSSADIQSLLLGYSLK